MKILTLSIMQYVPWNFTGKVIWEDGVIGYYLNSKYHRLDGPAFISTNIKQYILNGKIISINNKEKFYNSTEYKQAILLENMKRIKK